MLQLQQSESGEKIVAIDKGRRALRKTFSFAVKRILNCIVSAQSLNDLDPSR